MTRSVRVRHWGLVVRTRRGVDLGYQNMRFWHFCHSE